MMNSMDLYIININEITRQSIDYWIDTHHLFRKRRRRVFFQCFLECFFSVFSVVFFCFLKKKMRSSSRRKTTSSLEPLDSHSDTEEPMEELEEQLEQWSENTPMQDKEDNDTRQDKDMDKILSADGEPLSPEHRLPFPTFTLPLRTPSRPSFLFVVTLDLARATGYHDSFRLSKLFPSMRTLILSQQEKEKLIAIGIVHPIMRQRKVVVTSVREAFFHLGLRIFHNTANTATSTAVAHTDSAAGAIADTAKQAVKKAIQDLNLKQPPQPTIPGQDWMYQCAVTALKYNARLKAERHDRLYGQHQVHHHHPNHNLPISTSDTYSRSDGRGRAGRRSTRVGRTSYAEHDESDDFDESSDDDDDDDHHDDQDDDQPDDQHQDAETKEGQPSTTDEPQPERVVVVTRTGFMDVHTGVTQIPQLKNVIVKYHRVGNVTTQDVLRGHVDPRLLEGAFTLESLRQQQHQQPTSDDESAMAAPPKEERVLGSQLQDWLGPEFAHPQPTFALSLAPGQPQTHGSLYRTRFGQDDAQITNVTVQAWTLGNIYTAARTHRHFPVNPLPHLGMGGQGASAHAQSYQGMQQVQFERTTASFVASHPAQLAQVGTSASASGGSGGGGVGSSAIHSLLPSDPSGNPTHTHAPGPTSSHTSRSTTPIFDDSAKPECSSCHVDLTMLGSKRHPAHQVDALNRDTYLLSAVELYVDRAVQCNKCLKYWHFACLPRSCGDDASSRVTAEKKAKMSTYRWECHECRVCVKCRLSEENVRKSAAEHVLKTLEKKGRVVECARCERCFHEGCVEPALKKGERITGGKGATGGSVGDENGEWVCEVCAKCRSCGKESRSAQHSDLELVDFVADPHDVTIGGTAANGRGHKQGNEGGAGEERSSAMDVDQEDGKIKPETDTLKTHGVMKITPPDQPTYLTSLCKFCALDFEQGHFCPVCLKTHPANPMAGQEYDEMGRRKTSKKDYAVVGFNPYYMSATGALGGGSSVVHKVMGPPRSDMMVECDTCHRFLHFPHCDPEVFAQYGADRYLNKDRPPYQCPCCRLTASIDGGMYHLSTDYLLNSEDELELQHKRERKEKMSRKKRGRPRKYPMIVEPVGDVDEGVRGPLKGRYLTVFKGGVVVVPWWSRLYRWTNVAPTYNPNP